MALIDAAEDFFRRTWTRAQQSASSAAAAGADIGRYAVRRIRGREPTPTKVLDETVERLLVLVANQFIESKKGLAVCIADEKRLAKVAVQCSDDADEWERRALTAIKDGDTLLADECRARASDARALAAGYKDDWVTAKNAVDRLKNEIRQLNVMINDAKHTKTRVYAAGLRAIAREEARAEMRSARETLRVLNAMLAAAERVASNDPDNDAGNDTGGSAAPPPDDPSLN